MKMQHADNQKTQKGSSESFSGPAWQPTVAVGDAPNSLHIARVTFESGARTVWHAHPLSIRAADGRGQQAASMEPVSYEEYARAPEMTA